MSKHMKPRDPFKVFDKDATGFVYVNEFCHATGFVYVNEFCQILTSIGEKLEFDEWIREVDVGSEGKIRYEDLIARMVTK